jgi:hypothetical protein
MVDAGGTLAPGSNTLKNSGTLSVVTLTPPTFAGIQIIGGKLVVSGSGGVNYRPFVLLASTNLAAAHWTPVATNQFDSAGNFTCTNSIRSDLSQTFCQWQLQ